VATTAKRQVVRRSASHSTSRARLDLLRLHGAGPGALALWFLAISEISGDERCGRAAGLRPQK
jgi:hypothetical protein